VKEKRARGEKTAENVRFGQAVSESGFGGRTVGSKSSLSCRRTLFTFASIFWVVLLFSGIV